MLYTRWLLSKTHLGKQNQQYYTDIHLAVRHDLYHATRLDWTCNASLYSSAPTVLPHSVGYTNERNCRQKHQRHSLLSTFIFRLWI